MKILNIFKLNSLIRAYIIFSLPLLLIPAFVNFDAHHDGLVLTTVLQLKNAIQNGGPWPFNQYGQLWAFPFAFLSFLVSNQYLLISIRLLTFIYYLLTFLLLYKISSRFLTGSKTQFPPLLFLLAQPFALGLNSTFLPWPSALCALLITAALERLTKSYESKRRSDLGHFFAGVLIVATVGSRLQIGILLLLSVLVLQLLHRRFRELLLIFLGVISSLILVEFYMYSQGWLTDSIYDSVVFSSQYVTGDASTYPIPRVTFLLVALFVSCLLICDFIILKKFQVPRFSLAMTCNLTLFVLMVVFLASALSQLSFISWSTLFIRRLWISVSIAIVIYGLILLCIGLFKHRLRFTPGQLAYNHLYVFSVISLTQIVPLFDQMHFWWGFSPLAILLIVTLCERFLIQPDVVTVVRQFTIVLVTLLFAANLLGVVNQLSFARTPLNGSIASGVIVNDHTDNEISSYLNNTIKGNSKVLSLCPNSNVFFSVKSTRSAVREFVLWSPSLNFKMYRRDFLNSKYDYIVACPLEGASDTVQIEVNRSIRFILNHSKVLFSSSFLDAHNREWVIYRSI